MNPITLPVKAILHPTDFSQNSAYDFGMACSLALASNARLILLHVQPASLLIDDTSPNPGQPAELQEILIGKLPWPQPPKAEVQVEHRVAEGDAAFAILNVARDCQLGSNLMKTSDFEMNRLIH